MRCTVSCSPEELDEYHKKSVAEIEANFWGSEERLAYYRSHGLTDCSDYPGGDAAFERDVLAGDQRPILSFYLFTIHFYLDHTNYILSHFLCNSHKKPYRKALFVAVRVMPRKRLHQAIVLEKFWL